MAAQQTHDALEQVQNRKTELYRRLGFMIGATILTCATTIIFFNTTVSSAYGQEIIDNATLTAITLMPYLLSAVIAAITAIGAMTLLPTTRYVDPSVKMVNALRELADGDLRARVKLRTEDPMRDIANELNIAVENVNNQVTQWKIINRIQWGTLCRIRMAAEQGDSDDVLHFVEEMEKNWDKIADIEANLNT